MVVMALAVGADWQVVDHAQHIDWPLAIGSVLSALLFAALIFMLVRDWLTGAQYRTSSAFTDKDRELLRKEITKVEKKSSGRIVMVLSDRSDEHSVCGVWAALLTALISTAFFAKQLPWDDPARLVLWQLLFAAAGWGLSVLVPGFRRRFLGERRATEAAERCALEEFLSLGLARSEGEAGVLVFASLFERRVIVLGDRGVAAGADEHEWAKACYSVLEATRRGSLRIGVAEAVRRVGETLRRDFPIPAGTPVDPPAQVEVRSSTGSL